VDPLLQKLREMAVRLSVADFARHYAQPALALYLPDDDWSGFNTSVKSFNSITMDPGATADADELEKLDEEDEPGGGLAVRWIEKSERNPYADRISVGRANTCDVVVRHPSVSKLHAHFLRSGSGWAIRDANSKNGVSVNGVRLTAATAAPLQPDDKLTIGLVEARFVDARGLYAILRKSAL
jgi:hypothetical protein